MTETLATSLDNTQKNATDTEKSVQQSLSMSGKEMHDQTVSAILADGDLGMAEKLDLRMPPCFHSKSCSRCD